MNNHDSYQNLISDHFYDSLERDVKFLYDIPSIAWNDTFEEKFF